MHLWGFRGLVLGGLAGSPWAGSTAMVGVGKGVNMSCTGSKEKWM
jgi:hypothetical protein